MSGLLQRAAEYRANQRNLRLVKAESADGLEELGGTPEERLEILGRIDEVINENQIEIGPETFRVTARKRGILLPLLVNLTAILLVVVVAFYMIRTFADRESSVVNQATAVTSTEGRLLRQLREDSDAQLSAKDSEIAGIQNRLTQISAERQQLESSVNAQLSSQEEALRVEFQAALATERERLQGGGFSEAEIDQRLAEFQNQQQSEFTVQLDAIRAEAQQELQEREAALNALITDAEQSLADAESERSVLEADLRDQEVRLTSEFAAREAELTEERAAAVDLLAELQDQQQQERLVLDQIVAFYAGIQGNLVAGDFDAALQGTTSLRAYLSDGPAAELPTVRRRRRVELFLVESLEKRISDERGAVSPDTAALVESTSLVATVTELIAAANGAYGAAEFENAKTLYLAALSEIPAVRVGYDRLLELELQAGQVESERVGNLVRRGNSLYRAGAFQDAAAAYGEALATLPSADTGLLSRVLDAGYQLQRTNDVTALRSVRAELEAAQSTLAERQALLTEKESQLAGSADAASALRAQIAILQTRIDAAPTVPLPDPGQAERIAELESDLGSLNEAMAAQEDQIAALRLSVTDLNTLLSRSRAESDGLRQEARSFTSYVSFHDEQQELADEIVRYQQRFVTPAAAVERGAAGLAGSLQLLETKLLILRIIGSQAIRSQYPDLADQLNEYLDALVAEQRVAAAEETLADVNEVLDFLLDDAATVRATRAGQFPPGLADTGDESARFFNLLQQIARPGE